MIVVLKNISSMIIIVKILIMFITIKIKMLIKYQ
jgi:hypothetical protein